ncbi:hypothetical protein ACFV60_28475 [Streptomyces virginiae]|uniref:hypothetical protein n=1 Tax=Streptomyces virginiae TaxID=1961 RepID=UPI003651AB35
MPYEPAHPTAPAPLRYRDAILYPPAVPEPRMLPAEIPPGVQYVTLPDGTRTLAYTTQPEPAAARPVPTWAKTTALLAPTVGGGIAAASAGLAYAAPGLIALTEALWAAVALIAAGAVVAVARPRRGADRPATHITQHVTATGLFGRANGTINHR